VTPAASHVAEYRRTQITAYLHPGVVPDLLYRSPISMPVDVLVPGQQSSTRENEWGEQMK